MIGDNPLSVFAAAMSISGMFYTVAQSAYQYARPSIVEGVGAYHSPVTAGETVLIDWMITKRIDCPGQSSRVWSGENGFSMSESMRPTKMPVGTGTYKVETKIPDEAPEGDLKMTVSGYFECPHRDREYFSLNPIILKVAG